MPVSILKLAQSGEGASQACSLEFDKLEDVDLASPAKIDLTIYNLSEGTIFQAIGKIKVELDRVCDRCLESFSEELDLELLANFSDHPTEEDWPIENNMIDLAPVVRETILLNIPAKGLCSPDCTGIKIKNSN